VVDKLDGARNADNLNDHHEILAEEVLLAAPLRHCSLLPALLAKNIDRQAE
jgi:hypothetical protein